MPFENDGNDVGQVFRMTNGIGRGLLICLVAALLAILYVAMEWTGRRGGPPPAAVSFEIQARRSDAPGAPIPVYPTFRAGEGSIVTLAILSPTRGSLHVHGYEKSIALNSGVRTGLTFVADRAGRFPIHIHDMAEEMYYAGTLEIEPR
jgi:hypothetical protein